jgi:hypothetical protein
MTVVLLARADDTEARAAQNGRSQDQPARPFCCPPARPGWPMKSSRAWLTSSAWVQMIACGPPVMTVERAFFSNAGSLWLVAW